MHLINIDCLPCGIHHMSVALWETVIKQLINQAKPQSKLSPEQQHPIKTVRETQKVNRVQRDSSVGSLSKTLSHSLLACVILFLFN